MSEYQYYEFLAIDRPLTDTQMREVRGFSGRARITPTSFVNEYSFGDFRGSVASFMTLYYDAHVYVANWGTHRLILRFSGAGPAGIGDYCAGDLLSAYETGGSTLVEFCSESEDGEWAEGEGYMSSLAGLRADILSGDYRSLYLGWLNGVQNDEVDGDDLEPSVPPGLKELNAPLRELAEFLRLDESLLWVASEASAPWSAGETPGGDMRRWIEALPSGEKDALLFTLAGDSPMNARQEMLRRFRQETIAAPPAAVGARRTVAQIRSLWEQREQEEKRRVAEANARAEARRKEEAAKARQAYLDSLAAKEPACWKKVDDLIGTRQPKGYDQAVQLLRDLSDLAERQGRVESTASRVAALRAAHGNKPSLMRRMEGARL